MRRLKQVNRIDGHGKVNTRAGISLNIGCGADSWGDLRLDINKKYYGVRSSLNIVADAANLPFRDEAFEQARAYHVLEHLLDWKNALKEWVRVSAKIDIKIPKECYISIGIRTFMLELANLVFLSNRSLEALNFPKRRREHAWAITPQSVINILKEEGYVIHFGCRTLPLFKPLERVKKLEPFLPRTVFEYEITGVKSKKDSKDCLNPCTFPHARAK